MFNDTITLIGGRVASDKIGNQKRIQLSTEVLCEVRSCTRYEYYKNGASDRVPEFIVTVNSCEYHGETDCQFRDEAYNISRTYEKNRDLIELTLERKVGKVD